MATCSLFQSISFLQQTKCKYHTTHWNNYSNFISNLHLLLDLWRNLIEFNPCNTFFSCSYIPLYCKKGVCRYLRHLLCQEHAEMRECETEGGRDKVSTKLTLFLLWNEINHNPTDLNWAPAHYNIFPVGHLKHFLLISFPSSLSQHILGDVTSGSCSRPTFLNIPGIPTAKWNSANMNKKKIFRP